MKNLFQILLAVVVVAFGVYFVYGLVTDDPYDVPSTAVKTTGKGVDPEMEARKENVNDLQPSKTKQTPEAVGEYTNPREGAELPDGAAATEE